MDFIQYNIELKDFDTYSEILIAVLAEIGFDSFEEDSPLIKAFIEADRDKNDLLQMINFPEEQIVKLERKEVDKVNWNEEWEKNFPLLAIEDFCYIRAPFHDTVDGFEYELVIEPKMSFGTGHHATTQNMLLLMRGLDWPKSSVADIGSGTGILAIMAKKLGAETILANDIEEWAFENMQENFSRNNTPDIQAFHGSLPSKDFNKHKFDLLLANINKNVLLEQIEEYSKLLKPSADLILSGFYRADEKEISDRCREFNLEKQAEIEKDQWMAVHYRSS